jgi:acyl carrier protein
MTSIEHVGELIRELAASGALPRGLVGAVFDQNTRVDDLGIDSVGMVELLYAVEDRLGIHVPYDLVSPEMSLKTLAELIDQQQQVSVAA